MKQAIVVLIIAAAAVVGVSAGKGDENKYKDWPCAYGGRFYDAGDEWDPLPCGHCECLGFNSFCTFKTCPICAGVEGEAGLDGQCCGTCNGDHVEPTETGFCYWRGKRYENDEKFDLGPCIDCTCKDGTGECLVRSCEPNNCKKGEIEDVVEGECCLQCVPKA